MIEEDTVCLLDFYVHESVQRQGIGLELFKLALKVGLLYVQHEGNPRTFNFHGVLNSVSAKYGGPSKNEKTI